MPPDEAAESRNFPAQETPGCEAAVDSLGPGLLVEKFAMDQLQIRHSPGDLLFKKVQIVVTKMLAV